MMQLADRQGFVIIDDSGSWYESVYSECTGCFYTGARQ